MRGFLYVFWTFYFFKKKKRINAKANLAMFVPLQKHLLLFFFASAIQIIIIYYALSSFYFWEDKLENLSIYNHTLSKTDHTSPKNHTLSKTNHTLSEAELLIKIARYESKIDTFRSIVEATTFSLSTSFFVYSSRLLGEAWEKHDVKAPFLLQIFHFSIYCLYILFHSVIQIILFVFFLLSFVYYSIWYPKELALFIYCFLEKDIKETFKKYDIGVWFNKIKKKDEEEPNPTGPTTSPTDI